jgi:hypothetical protein
MRLWGRVPGAAEMGEFPDLCLRIRRRQRHEAGCGLFPLIPVGVRAYLAGMAYTVASTSRFDLRATFEGARPLFPLSPYAVRALLALGR